MCWSEETCLECRLSSSHLIKKARIVTTSSRFQTEAAEWKECTLQQWIIASVKLNVCRTANDSVGSIKQRRQQVIILLQKKKTVCLFNDLHGWQLEIQFGQLHNYMLHYHFITINLSLDVFCQNTVENFLLKDYTPYRSVMFMVKVYGRTIRKKMFFKVWLVWKVCQKTKREPLYKKNGRRHKTSGTAQDQSEDVYQNAQCHVQWKPHSVSTQTPSY